EHVHADEGQHEADHELDEAAAHAQAPAEAEALVADHRGSDEAGDGRDQRQPGEVAATDAADGGRLALDLRPRPGGREQDLLRARDEMLPNLVANHPSPRWCRRATAATPSPFLVDALV